MDLALLEDGFIVMIIGMGTVFVFLSIMIFAMHLNGKVLQVLNKFFPEEIPVEKKPVQKSDNNEEIALAIACAMAAAGKKQTA
ncbi:TPA: oxaloacetate decarboxylase subunit gamma [Candidatus Gastranaerophilales bacterium HUM_3]|jgi:oxaloacetate decarboxylase (Na+ extruding) subunit gamma|nr:probable oxaloacetate decarboxylase gamma chain [Acinetobacter sp. CAG:196]DAA84499.1 MAG TPA: oxaloacetate decarboxylase subunit gamma [Candidatus Gastranaerophilales bacterium HUM_3]DAA84868.1 MAG TPA: oxaloacetate decarboxylase subunit gamma [Candidatus Gastranaerophilales bacterium HUM_4]DAA91042.1 MAG TPA: oxaloacetate decarboxylase subunit gamma [Candidatus Gastranaerophilales bacterium HUM_5]DAA94469.1 MAG TPA: oxaloacetate decarboxylase subunit gamma [Candidatus Gastranaerophilales b